MASNRLIELAIKGLEAEKTRIEQELADLKLQMNGHQSKSMAKASDASARRTTSRKRGRLTAEGRKRLSESAKMRWAARRKIGKTTL